MFNHFFPIFKYIYICINKCSRMLPHTHSQTYTLTHKHIQMRQVVQFSDL